jgi:hypothetical protein
MQQFGGAADIASFRYGNKITDLAQVEHFFSLSSPQRSQL